MKKLTIILGLLTAVSVFGFDAGNVAGGDIDTTKADELLAQIDEITANFEDCTARLDAATEAINNVCAAYGISDVLGDPAATAGIAGDLSDDERVILVEALENVADVPDILASLGTDIPAVMEKIPDVMTDLTNQISDNPTKAAGAKEVKSKLTEAQEKLGEIAPAAAETTASANELSATVSALL